jgi:peptidoglycan hydrolase-like protein with peptidoglycan-binding domain
VFLPTNITLQFGDTGDFVAELQRRLSRLDLLGEMMVNASFDGNTINAVKSFQSIHGLRVDGVAGPETLRRIAGILSGTAGGSATSDNKQEEEKQQLRDGYVYQQMVAPIPAPSEPSLEALLSESSAANQNPYERPASAPALSSPMPPSRPDLAAAAQRSAADLLGDALAQSAHQERAAEAARGNPHTEAKPDIKTEGKPPSPTEMKPDPAAKAASGNAAKTEEPNRDAELQPQTRRPFSAFLQKIVDYIESKLPRHITQEVKEIGQTMLRAGVREASGALDAPARGQELEAGRGAQAQTPQRG